MIKLTAPFTKKKLSALKAGDIVSISGDILTARDAAHIRLDGLIKEGSPLPFELEGQIIYYTGACPAQWGEPIGSCGPTTSKRMDAFTPGLLDRGLIATIGKGERGAAVTDSIKTNRAVYFYAVGGAGAYYSKAVRNCVLVCFGDLGTEAVYRLTVEDFKVIVAVDAEGNSI